jgi:hypothetical protein
MLPRTWGFFKITNPTPLLRGGRQYYRAGVLTFTVGGTVPEFHRLALQLSPSSPEGAPDTTIIQLGKSIADPRKKSMLALVAKASKYKITASSIQEFSEMAKVFGFRIWAQKFMKDTSYGNRAYFWLRPKRKAPPYKMGRGLFNRYKNYFLADVAGALLFFADAACALTGLFLCLLRALWSPPLMPAIYFTSFFLDSMSY